MRYGLLGAVFLSFVGLTTRRRSNGSGNGSGNGNDRRGSVLGPQHLATAAAVAARMTPKSEQFPAADNLDIGGQIDEFLALSPIGLQAEFLELLALLESSLFGLLFDGRPTPFSASRVEEQDRTLERWRTSRLGIRRMGFRALQSLCGALYYSDPKLRDAIGYAGPPALHLNATGADVAPDEASTRHQARRPPDD